MTYLADRKMPPLSRLLNRIGLIGADWVRLRVAPGHGFVMPAGDHLSVHLVTQGELEMQVGEGQPMSVQMGAAILLPHGSQHSLRCEGGSSLRRLDYFAEADEIDIPATINIGSPGNGGATVLTGQLHLDWPVELPNVQSLPAVLHGTRTYDSQRPAAEAAVRALEITARSPGAAACLSRYAELLLTRELRDVLYSHPELFRARDDLSAAMVRAVEAVRMKPAHAWTVERLARYVAMSRSTFAAAFKGFYQRGPMEVVTEQRMEIAAKMLRESNLRVKAVAAKVGYTSDTAFMRRFVAHFGVAPTAYKREMGFDDGAMPEAWPGF